MTAFMIEKKFGKDIADLWTSSGKLPDRPDPVTNSNADNHKQYIVPMDWIEKASGRKDSLELAGSQAATEADRANWDSIADYSLTSSSSGQGVPLRISIKLEPKTQKELDADEITEFMADPTNMLIDTQNIVTNMKVLAAQVPQDNSFGTFLQEQAVSIEKQAVKVVKATEKSSATRVRCRFRRYAVS